MSDVTKVKLGPCSINVNGTDVGHTTGGSQLVYTPTYHDTMVDKFGKTVVERWLLSEALEVDATLAEWTFANLKVAMPNGVQSATKITLGAIAGKKQSANATVVVLHPLENLVGDRSGDVVLYRAIVSGPISIDYKADGERTLKVKFSGLINENNADGNMLGLIGDSTT